jgi:hypothetical protein
MRRFTCLPLACYAGLLAYACYGWFQVGHWPYYAHPDPKELPHDLLLRITSIVFLIGVLSILLTPLVYVVWRTLAAWKKWSVPAQGGPMILYLTGVTMWVLDFSAEFTKVPWTSTISWLLD